MRFGLFRVKGLSHSDFVFSKVKDIIIPLSQEVKYHNLTSESQLLLRPARSQRHDGTARTTYKLLASARYSGSALVAPCRHPPSISPRLFPTNRMYRTYIHVDIAASTYHINTMDIS